MPKIDMNSSPHSGKKKRSFWVIEPEASATLGDNTLMSDTQEVLKLHLDFQGWLGDDLGNETEVYYVTERLKRAIEKHRLTGCGFERAEATKAVAFQQMDPDFVLPRFYWMKIFGTPGEDDLGLDRGVYLTISDQALSCFRNFIVEQAEIKPWK